MKQISPFLVYGTRKFLTINVLSQIITSKANRIQETEQFVTPLLTITKNLPHDCGDLPQVNGLANDLLDANFLGILDG